MVRPLKRLHSKMPEEQVRVAAGALSLRIKVNGNRAGEGRETEQTSRCQLERAAAIFVAELPSRPAVASVRGLLAASATPSREYCCHHFVVVVERHCRQPSDARFVEFFSKKTHRDTRLRWHSVNFQNNSPDNSSDEASPGWLSLQGL